MMGSREMITWVLLKLESISLIIILYKCYISISNVLGGKLQSIQQKFFLNINAFLIWKSWEARVVQGC